MSYYRSTIAIAILVFAILFSMLYYTDFVTASNADREFCKPMAYVDNRIKSFDFKFPSYLPEGYRYQCGFAGNGEGHVVYWNQKVDAQEFVESQSQFVELHKGAIYQFMQKTPVDNATALVISQYNHILEVNPALNPKIVDIGNGRIAWVNGIAEDVAGQTAEFSNGSKVIVVNSTLPSRLRTYYDEGYGLHLEGYVAVEELIKIAKSMR